MSTTYLLLRSHDLVVIGVRWSGPDPVAGDLIAPSEGAVLTIVHPPQHVAEQVQQTDSEPQDIGGVPVWRARLSAPSTVTFAVAAGARIPFTVEGVLAASAAARANRDGTVLEIPWRVHLAPDVAAWRHAARPVAGPDGTIGLWRTRAAEPSAPVAVNVLVDAAAETPDPFAMGLSQADRLVLMENASDEAALARRLELTTLGGTLSASGRWPGFSWDHEIALGRDILVHTVTEVRMFPFGHRAELESVTRRVFDHATGTASLQKQTTLQFVDPVVTTPEGAVTFPFDTVEVLQPSHPGLPEPAWSTRARGSALLDALRAQLADLEGEYALLSPAIHAAMTADVSLEEYALVSDLAHRVLEARDALGRIQADFDAAEANRKIADGLDQRIARATAEIARLQQLGAGADGYDYADEIRVQEDLITEWRAQMPWLPDNATVTRWLRERADAQAVMDAHWPQVFQEMTADRSIDDLVANGVEGAARYQELETTDIPAKRGEVEKEAAESEHPFPWYVLVHDADGVLQIPVRMTGPEGDVDARIPMIAVRAFRWDPPYVLETFDSVTAPETIAAVTTLWRDAGAGDVAIVPTRVDLVRDARRARRAGRALDANVSAAAGDVRVVHAMSLAGHLVDGSYRAALDSFTIALPELDVLLPKPPGAPRWATKAFTYAQEFRDDPAADLLFEAIGDPLDISFLDDARNAGGMLSPRIAADAISRRLGPVAASALRGAILDPLDSPRLDPAQLFADGATLLGFDLRTILDEIALDKAPSIVHDIVDGKPPTVRMTWEGIPVKGFESFVSTDTTLDVGVTIGPDGATVTCTLTAFELALPTPATELLRLRFTGLTCTMVAGQAPDLAIGGVSADFSGELRLIQELGAHVGLGDGGPRVVAGSDGISASYEVAVPPVTTTGFQLRDITFRAGVDVPFGKKSPSISIAFASREKPFLATVLMFGGGGYFDLVVDGTGIRRLEASIEFGASIGVDFFVAKAEMHVLGAFRYTQSGTSIVLDGFLRMGGSVKILGLVTVSVEVVLALSYRSASNQLVGRATLVLEIDLTLYSTSVELDTGPWVISGSADTAPRALDDDRRLAPEQIDPDLFVEQWRRYRGAFA